MGAGVDFGWTNKGLGRLTMQISDDRSVAPLSLPRSELNESIIHTMSQWIGVEEVDAAGKRSLGLCDCRRKVMWA